MSLTQCKACEEWCEGTFCSEECKEYYEEDRNTPL